MLYQIIDKNSKDVALMYSFEAFATKDDAERWLNANVCESMRDAYELDECEDDGIENPTIFKTDENGKAYPIFIPNED